MTMTSLRQPAVALAAGLLSAALVLTACGSDTESTGDDGSTGGGPAAGYPVTVDTAWGEITLAEKPERIVTVGVNYVDMLASIGEQPVAFSAGRWTDEQELLNDHPWVDGLFESDQFDPSMAIAGFEVSAEAVAAHEPDLIIGNIWNIPEDQYEQFSQIAPTYVGIKPDRATDWEDHLTALGALTGKADEAAQAIDDVEADFAAARDRLPGLQGKTYNQVAFFPDEREFGFGGADWPDDLGLVPAENQPAPFETGSEPVSMENIELLAADVLLIGSAPAAGWSDPEEVEPLLEADPRYSELPAYQNGAVLLSEHRIALAGATNLGPASLSWLVEQIVPEMENLPLTP